MKDLTRYTFEDHPDNPLISPPGREFIIADPTVVVPDKSPDNRWHLFAHSLRGIHHYASDDGIDWKHKQGPLFIGMRPFIFIENGYHLFYERFARPWRTVVAVRSSTDLENWSEPRTVLSPSRPWEGRILRTNSNPCVVRHDGRYRLYYAAGWIWLKDCYFIEPKFIGVAESDLLLGPYKKMTDPILSPGPDPYWRNLGAGSIKVLEKSDDENLFALNNGIYIDKKGQSRSEIWLLESTDGIDWNVASEQPLVAPEPGWKNALVYAMHLSEYEGQLYLYYNARDGWFRGTERIGVAVGKLV